MSDVRILICGSRPTGLTPAEQLRARAMVAQRVDTLKARFGDRLLIVHGGASGVDSYAEEHAAAVHVRTESVRPDYDKYGKRAPLVRDEVMVDTVRHVIAFWDGVSRGTLYTVTYAMKRRVSHEVYFVKTNAERS